MENRLRFETLNGLNLSNNKFQISFWGWVHWAGLVFGSLDENHNIMLNLLFAACAVYGLECSLHT